jgi:tRNA isopentenyl-2-thiomethyl-A-37 hydroxylase MiaE
MGAPVRPGEVVGYPAFVDADLALTDVFGLLAYGQLQAFDRMAADARLAPDLHRRAVLSEMAAAEIAHFRRLLARLAARTVDAYAAMAPFAGPLEAYHEQTEPRDWLEALVKAYVGDSIADDFYSEIAGLLDPENRDFVLDVLHDRHYTDFAATEIRQAIAADPKVANPLSMWARRLVGEAMSQATHVAAERPALIALVAQAGGADEEGVPEMLKRVTAAHTARMVAVGLNN